MVRPRGEKTSNFMVGLGVVPRRSDFKSLHCQTALSAITGAQGILVLCKTEAVTPRRFPLAATTRQRTALTPDISSFVCPSPSLARAPPRQAGQNWYRS